MFPSSSRVFRWNGAKVYSQTEWAHGWISLHGSATDAGHVRICSNRKSATWVQRTLHFRFSAVLLVGLNRYSVRLLGSAEYRLLRNTRHSVVPSLPKPSIGKN